MLFLPEGCMPVSLCQHFHSTQRAATHKSYFSPVNLSQPGTSPAFSFVNEAKSQLFTQLCLTARQPLLCPSSLPQKSWLCLSFDPALKCMENLSTIPFCPSESTPAQVRIGAAREEVSWTACNWQLISWVLFYCWARMIKITPTGRSPKGQALQVAYTSLCGRAGCGLVTCPGRSASSPMGALRGQCPVGP